MFQGIPELVEHYQSEVCPAGIALASTAEPPPRAASPVVVRRDGGSMRKVKNANRNASLFQPGEEEANVKGKGKGKPAQAPASVPAPAPASAPAPAADDSVSQPGHFNSAANFYPDNFYGEILEEGTSENAAGTGEAQYHAGYDEFGGYYEYGGAPAS